MGRWLAVTRLLQWGPAYAGKGAGRGAGPVPLASAQRRCAGAVKPRRAGEREVPRIAAPLPHAVPSSSGAWNGALAGIQAPGAWFPLGAHGSQRKSSPSGAPSGSSG